MVTVDMLQKSEKTDNRRTIHSLTQNQVSCRQILGPILKILVSIPGLAHTIPMNRFVPETFREMGQSKGLKFLALSENKESKI